MQLASSGGSLGPLTQEEKKRLEELLKDIDEGEHSVSPTSEPEVHTHLHTHTLVSLRQDIIWVVNIINLMIYIWMFSQFFLHYKHRAKLHFFTVSFLYCISHHSSRGSASCIYGVVYFSAMGSSPIMHGNQTEECRCSGAS